MASRVKLLWQKEGTHPDKMVTGKVQQIRVHNGMQLWSLNAVTGEMLEHDHRRTKCVFVYRGCVPLMAQNKKQALVKAARIKRSMMTKLKERYVTE